MAAAEATPGRLTELDGLRGLAALSVVGYHWLLVDPANHGGPVSGPLTSHMNWLYATPLEGFLAGQFMVLLFFVLSGLVLALPRVAGREISFWRYVVSRGFRLLPVAWAAVVFAELVSVAGHLGAGPAVSPWVNAQLTTPAPSVAHLVGMVFPFNPSRLDGPLWSLEQELRASLLLPFLVAIVQRCRWPVAVTLAITLIVAGTASTTDLDSWAWTPAVAGCFILGVLLARHREMLNARWESLSGRTRRWIAAGSLLSFWVPARMDAGVIYLAPIFGACAVIIAAQGPELRGWLRSAPLAWLGRISFSLYVIHVPVVHVLLLICPRGFPAVALAPVGIAASLGLATLMQRRIEAPGIALGRAVVKRSWRRREVLVPA